MQKDFKINLKIFLFLYFLSKFNLVLLDFLKNISFPLLGPDILLVRFDHFKAEL